MRQNSSWKKAEVYVSVFCFLSLGERPMVDVQIPAAVHVKNHLKLTWKYLKISAGPSGRLTLLHMAPFGGRDVDLWYGKSGIDEGPESFDFRIFKNAAKLIQDSDRK